MLKCLIYGCGITTILYIFIAYLGYFSFGNDNINKDLIKSPYNNDVLLLIAEILLSIYVIGVTPLFAHAFRKAVAEVLLITQKEQNNTAVNEHNINTQLMDDSTNNSNNNNNNNNNDNLIPHGLTVGGPDDDLYDPPESPLLSEIEGDGGNDQNIIKNSKYKY